MSDSPIPPEVLNVLLARAEWRRQQDKLEASLLPHEKSMRERFEKALFGAPGPMEVAEVFVSDPTNLLVMAEAYRREGARRAAEASIPRIPYGRKLTAKEKKAAEQRAVDANAPYVIAVHVMVMIWLALRGHDEAERILAQRRKMPPLPPLPRGWWNLRAEVYEAMGEELPPEAPRVVSLDAYR